MGTECLSSVRSARTPSASCRQSGQASRCRATRSRSLGASSPRTYGPSSVSGWFAISARLHRLLECPQRPVQVHAHRRLRALQHRGDLRGRELLLHLEDHRRALLAREPVHRRPERGQRPLPAEGVDGVGERGRLAVEERLARVRIRLVARPEAPAPALPAVVQAQVDQDPVEPGREFRAPGEARRGLVEPDERLLRQIARVLGVPEDGPGEPVRAFLVSRDEEVERRLVSIGHTLAKHFIGRLHAPRVLAPTFPLLTPTPQVAQASGVPRSRSETPLLRLSLTPLLHVLLEVSAVAPELPRVPAPLARVGLQVLPVLADLLPILRDGVLVARLTILIELPSVLAQVATVLPDIPRVLTQVPAVLPDVPAVL